MGLTLVIIIIEGPTDAFAILGIISDSPIVEEFNSPNSFSLSAYLDSPFKAVLQFPHNGTEASGQNKSGIVCTPNHR